ncbi:hypothetical protein BpHYR1_026510 [Brachionus plicatilis]|uniref:Uncharacterized protein n=1 Tax=Brachionus plicatilis TaxID=10195 RepID=A0A3M7PA59_BRAPC|nr:hypothetical protein BpHYR1_026510 [Brachionus plicatilis]
MRSRNFIHSSNKLMLRKKMRLHHLHNIQERDGNNDHEYSESAGLQSNQDKSAQNNKYRQKKFKTENCNLMTLFKVLFDTVNFKFTKLMIAILLLRRHFKYLNRSSISSKKYCDPKRVKLLQAIVKKNHNFKTYGNLKP